MKILDVKYNDFNFDFFKKRMVKIDDPIQVVLHTDEGKLVYSIESGFITDLRSGGRLVDYIIPHFGTEKYTLAPLVHDASFQSHCVSFELANEIFRQMLIWSGVKPWRARVAYWGVSSCFGRMAYNKRDKWDKKNAGKVHFKWKAR